MDSDIDFVLTWVDGDDEEWRKSRNSCLGMEEKVSPSLYRNWDNLQYWFRGVERYTPWVNKIHFVTCGHLPKWLNTGHPKLHIVKHADYLPEKYLPTFNSHAIELNLHRIAGLAEQFVYFNDDTFVMNHLQPTDFFRKGLPCGSVVMLNLVPKLPQDPFFHYLINNLAIINHQFSKKEVLKKNWRKWYSIKYGRHAFGNIYHSLVGGFSGFLDFHLAAAFLKTTFEEVWEKEPEVLDATSLNKFRTVYDVNQYVFSYWQYAAGNFAPVRTNQGRFFLIRQNNDEILECLSLRKYKMICINDNPLLTNFDEKKEALNRQFSQLLPERSEFEL